jgi:hypothetical protein
VLYCSRIIAARFIGRFFLLNVADLTGCRELIPLSRASTTEETGDGCLNLMPLSSSASLAAVPPIWTERPDDCREFVVDVRQLRSFLRVALSTRHLRRKPGYRSILGSSGVISHGRRVWSTRDRNGRDSRTQRRHRLVQQFQQPSCPCIFVYNSVIQKRLQVRLFSVFTT